MMKVEILPDEKSLARRAAAVIAKEARAAVAEHGRFVMAVSGGKSPWVMLADLADEQVPWANVHVFQIDERIAPAGDPDRNYVHLRDSLLAHAPIPPNQIYAMPVEMPDSELAAKLYAQTLESVAGKPPVLDLAHLGLGPDGHTASLIPGDPVLNVTNRDIAVTGVYQGRTRMTMTYPVINRASKIMWLVSGKDKVAAFAKLRAADPSVPAGRIRQTQSLLLADKDAAGE
jgi:6-phosphogluconolactonase